MWLPRTDEGPLVQSRAEDDEGAGPREIAAGSGGTKLPRPELLSGASRKGGGAGGRYVPRTDDGPLLLSGVLEDGGG
jgi:hypothetical protein